MALLGKETPSPDGNNYMMWDREKKELFGNVSEVEQLV